jgi:PAP2 superfamily
LIRLGPGFRSRSQRFLHHVQVRGFLPVPDVELKSLFAAPNHPSYPAAHGCLSTAAATVLARLFPLDRDRLPSLGKEAAEARVWAGIHYRFDIEAGQEIGRKVAEKTARASFRDAHQLDLCAQSFEQIRHTLGGRPACRPPCQKRYGRRHDTRSRQIPQTFRSTSQDLPSASPASPSACTEAISTSRRVAAMQ